ncbi:hypothetical protein AN958_08328 [Leucoagaricus sp. SymC.cos]|nr:hypothetical protein AN958_08328 [Leucoagaricus sp. SymC.cos]
MIDVTQNLDSEDKVLDRLEAKGLLAAMLDSKERSYPPKCNPETRHRLRSRIIEWGNTPNPALNRRALWLSGPAGVGKSAVAQTVAEKFQEDRILGAAFFFSRPNCRDDPDTLIPTLAYQLAVHHCGYRSIIAHQIADDPSILKKHRRAQFNALIIDPFRILLNDLTRQHPDIVLRPLFIVVDGLDECADRQAQREFVAMITDYTGVVDRYPLLWMICSREESHLKSAFADTIVKPNRMQFKFSKMASLRSERGSERTGCHPIGHLALTKSVSPKRHQDILVGQMPSISWGLGGPGALNPLHALDLLYTEILSSVPVIDFINVSRILGTMILYSSSSLTALTLANFLGFSQDAFYRSLQRLHSVVYVPSASEADTTPIRVYHASFSDYLKATSRSKNFALDESIVHQEAALRALQWLNRGNAPDIDGPLAPKLRWMQNKDNPILHEVMMFSAATCWKSCPRVQGNGLVSLMDRMESFDFHLGDQVWGDDLVDDFAHFISWLHSLGRENRSLVSVEDLSTHALHFEHKDSALPNELEKLTSTGDVEPDPEQPSPLPDAHTPVQEELASVPPETDTPQVSYCRPNPIPQYWGAGGPLSRYSTTPYNLLGSRSPFVQSSGFPLGGSVFGPQPTYGSEYVPTLETTYNAPFYPQSSPFALPLPPLMPPFPSASISPTGKRDRNASRLRTKIELAKDKPELKIPDLDTFVRIGHIVAHTIRVPMDKPPSSIYGFNGLRFYYVYECPSSAG